MTRVQFICDTVLLALAAFGCSKNSGGTASASAPPASPAVANAPASAGPAASVAASAATASAPVNPGTAGSPSLAVASTPAADAINPRAAAAAEPESPEAERKREQIEWAILQDRIKNDPNGQWAAAAKASSAYNDAQGASPFSPGHATGAPDVETFGSSGSAWSPKTPEGGIEWLELEYSKPVHATALRVRESYGPGVVIKVELFESNGVSHVVWAGTDSTRDLNYLTVEWPKTAYTTNRVRLTLATNAVRGWNQIDAVQLVGTEQ